MLKMEKKTYKDKMWARLRSWFIRPNQKRYDCRCPNYDLKGLLPLMEDNPFYKNKGDQGFDQPPTDFLFVVNNEDDKYKIFVDVILFKRGEVAVERIGRYITVEGYHEEQEHMVNQVTRHYKRWFPIPPEFDPSTIKCERYYDDKIAILVEKYAKKVDKGTNTDPVTAAAALQYDADSILTQILCTCVDKSQSNKTTIVHMEDPDEDEAFVVPIEHTVKFFAEDHNPQCERCAGVSYQISYRKWRLFKTYKQGAPIIQPGEIFVVV